MNLRKHVYFILPMLVVLALTACGGRAAPSQPGIPGTPVVLPDNPNAPAPATLAGTQAAQAADVQPPPATVTPVFVPPTQEQSDGGFRVKLFSPSEIVVYQPDYEIAGEAPADTVVTVNDEILLVEAEETFSVKVPLEEGPNLIEVVASSVEGQEVQFNLIATYQATP